MHMITKIFVLLSFFSLRASLANKHHIPFITQSYCPTVMRSVKHDTSSGSVWLENSTPLPSMREGDIMVKVAATALNRADLLQASGRYPPPPGESEILGLEIAGTVAELSPEAAEKSNLKQGQQVMALVAGGGYAEYCRAPYQCVVPVPQGMDLPTAASIPESYITAYQALSWVGNLTDGETVLIHAGSSGVGLAATQLAKALWKQVTVITTASSTEKLSISKQNGADVGINYKTQDFAEEVLKATNSKGANVIIDFVGGSYWERNMKSIAVDGRMVILGLMGGAVTETPVNLGVILRKRLSVRGSTLRARSVEYKEKLMKELFEQVLPLFTTGQLKPVVDKYYTLDEVQEAHQRMRNNINKGKIILTM